MHPAWRLGIWADVVGFIQWRLFSEPVGEIGKLRDLPGLWRTSDSTPEAGGTAESMSMAQSAPCLVSAGSRNAALLFVPIRKKLCQ